MKTSEKRENNLSHLAIIMDGNGRWSEQKGLPREDGHKEGVKSLRKLLRYIDDFNIPYLTVFSKNVKIRIIGNREGVPKDIVKLIDSSEFLTRDNDGLYLQIAFNYSGRDEIINALKKIGTSIKSGDIDPYNINEDIVNSNLFTEGLPEPDLLIRTGSEKRISNFLLWQLAYTEIYFEKALWPDFNKDLLTKAVNDFNNRYRRYGRIEERLKK